MGGGCWDEWDEGGRNCPLPWEQEAVRSAQLQHKVALGVLNVCSGRGKINVLEKVGC